MSLDLVQEIVKNKFLLILLKEKGYMSRLGEIIESIEKTKTRICYVCMSKPYVDVMEDLNGGGVDTDNFFFIDVLTSHYRKPEPAENCIFVPEPTDLTKIRVAIKKAVEENDCSAVLFDTISTLLIYQKTSSIVRFTHDLLAEEEKEDVKKLFILLKGNDVPVEENQELVNDLTMFADKTIDMDQLVPKH